MLLFRRIADDQNSLSTLKNRISNFPTSQPKIRYASFSAMNFPIMLFSVSAALLSPLIAETVAIYDLNKPITENGQHAGNPFLLDSPERPLTQFDLVQSLKKAATDPEVPAVVIDVDGANFSLAQAQEVRRLLLEIRRQDKDVWIYTEYLTPISTLLGSAANHFSLMPAGDVRLQGLYGESLYFKNMLDKLGLKVEVIHIGDFKSAGEELYRDRPSEFAQQQQNTLLDSVYQQIICQIAEGRGLTNKEVEAIVDLGSLSPAKAKELQLVNHLYHRTEFVNTIRKTYGADVKFDDSYHLPNLHGPEISGFFDLMKVLLNSGQNKNSKQPYIAVVPLEGVITDQSIVAARREILRASRNKNCYALVLRVNSPGGSALASDVLWEATKQFKNTKRPFVVSMGSVAASGGYYVSALADQIYAEPGTITGSIGVVGMKLVMGGALEKMGINVHTNQRGQHADIMNSNRPYTAEETALVRQSMLEVYTNFKQRISDGRGARLKGDLEKLAGGRVYSGEEALKVGLVDKLGGLAAAIDHAVALSGAGDAKIKLLPQPKGPFEGLFALPEKDEHEFIQADSPEATFILKNQLIADDLLKLLGPNKTRQFEYFFQKIESVHSQGIQLLAPQFDIH